MSCENRVVLGVDKLTFIISNIIPFASSYLDLPKEYISRSLKKFELLNIWTELLDISVRQRSALSETANRQLCLFQHAADKLLLLYHIPKELHLSLQSPDFKSTEHVQTIMELKQKNEISKVSDCFKIYCESNGNPLVKRNKNTNSFNSQNTGSNHKNKVPW